MTQKPFAVWVHFPNGNNYLNIKPEFRGLQWPDETPLYLDAHPGVPTAKHALKAIANLEMPKNLDIAEGHEQAYRVIEALFESPPEIDADEDRLDIFIAKAQELSSKGEYAWWVQVENYLRELRELRKEATK